MRVGIVAWWHHRGQGTVARDLRSALTTLRHDTFVLARPPRGGPPAAGDAAAGVDAASSYRIPAREYLGWARSRGIEAAFFDQNYQFDEIEALRRSGVRTIGRFVWEAFGAEHVAGARRAFDVVYSMTACERDRYREMGIASPRVRWGCHPDLLAVPVRQRTDAVWFFYPGGYAPGRKSIAEIVAALALVRRPDVRVLLKLQRPLTRGDLAVRHRRTSRGLRGLLDRAAVLWRRLPARIGDPRVVVVEEDLPTDEHHALFASCHVCLAPSKWEGLGLHLYEATAFGMPIITNDAPPMNEIVRDGRNGRLVRSRHVGRTPSGIPAYSPEIGDLATAITDLADGGERARLAAGAREVRAELSWDTTVHDLAALLGTTG